MERRTSDLPSLFRTTMLAALIVLLSGTFFPATAAVRGGTEPFSAGSLRLSLFFGGGTAFGEHYSIIGAGAGYYVLDDLELGLDAETWRGNEPRITRYSPQVMYVLPLGERARPYAGVFYRRTLIDQYKNLSDVGGRAGVLFLSGQGAYFGAGAVYERHLGCDRTVFESCSGSYLELLLAFVF